MGRTALIGYTGFVGSNLLRQTEFTDTYNSQNIDTIDNSEFDLVVCAGARATKWLINQQPEQDLQEINDLIAHLRTISAQRFVLISTVDVYNKPVDVDEDTHIDPNQPFTHKAYAKHRYMLEEFCRQQFPACTVVRLSGLFGPGLKKNVIYDLLHNNNVDKINPDSEFQYYNIEHLWHDLSIALDNKVPLINLMSAPVRTSELAKECFNIDLTGTLESAASVFYDMHTKHAKLFGTNENYLASKEQISEEIAAFVQKERPRG